MPPPSRSPGGGSSDRVLVKRVNEIIKSPSAPAYLKTEPDSVLSELCARHAEYNRRPKQSMIAAINKIIACSTASTPVATTPSTKGSSSNNNKNNANDEDEDAMMDDDDNGEDGEDGADDERASTNTGRSNNNNIVVNASTTSTTAATPGTGVGMVGVKRTAPVVAAAAPPANFIQPAPDADGNPPAANKSSSAAAPRSAHRSTSSKRARVSSGGKGVYMFRNNGNEQGLDRGGQSNSNQNLGVVTVAPSVRLQDVGGVDTVLQDIREIVEYPLIHPEVYAHLGVSPPKGVLLHGPPGSGKTMLANAIAAELMGAGVSYFRISATEVVSGMSGESEQKIRDLFAQARAQAPSLLFLDEIDAIAPKRESAGRQMEARIVAQLLASMDGLNEPMGSDFDGVVADLFNDGASSAGGGGAAAAAASSSGVAPMSDASASAAAAAPTPSAATTTKRETFIMDDGLDFAPELAKGAKKLGPQFPPPVMVIAATNRPDAIDSALRCAGRFDREIALGVPDDAARLHILQKMTGKMKLEGNFDLHSIARLTPGYVGADLAALTREAATAAVNRIFKTFDPTAPNNKEKKEGIRALQAGSMQLSAAQLAPVAITMRDFVDAVAKVQPSAKREGFATVPDVTWEDIGALEDVRAELKMAIVEPIRHPERFAALGITAAAGVLLFGPPGCGKTLLAKAVAHESGANFISVKGPELLNKFVGESERAVRQVFTRGRASAPCVIFFDELDALCPRRGSDTNQATERVVNMLLTEMDGLDDRRQVFIVAATNRPDILDAAMMRPGRLDKLLYVSLPNADQRFDILKKLTRKMPLSADVDLKAVASSPHCQGFSGADLASLVREAATNCMREEMDIPAEQLVIHARHFETAFSTVLPSVSRRDEAKYDSMRSKIRQSRAHIKKDGEGVGAAAAAAGGGGAGSAADALP